MLVELEDALREKFAGKSVGIWGFGREGKSTYALLRRLFPDMPLVVADQSEHLFSYFENLSDPHTQFFGGEDHLCFIDFCDVVIKSPGVNANGLASAIVSSQTEIFMELLRDQIIGITGTKGKSTTTTLIFHLLKQSGKNVIITGNIGVPSFDILDQVKADSIIVYELSAHQLQDITTSPRISVLLNVFQEHLDHFGTFDAYCSAKFRILQYQKPGDVFIYWYDQPLPVFNDECGYGVTQLAFSLTSADCYCHAEGDELVWGEQYRLLRNFPRKLKGEHNLLNIMAAISVCLAVEIDKRIIPEALADFSGLPHRIENLGTFNGVTYYNDSIATIPEACMQALMTLEVVDILLLGGFDRGIDYSGLINFLASSSLSQVIFIGEAGRRMYSMAQKVTSFLPNCTLAGDFDSAVSIAKGVSFEGACCLLSPAAASYDEFKNFEHRGDRFRELVRE